MSPELICGLGYTYDVDIWALGVCIFEIVFGYLPWGEFMEDPYEINKSILTEPLELPENVDEMIPQRLGQLINQMLLKDVN